MLIIDDLTVEQLYGEVLQLTGADQALQYARDWRDAYQDQVDNLEAYRVRLRTHIMTLMGLGLPKHHVLESLVANFQETYQPLVRKRQATSVRLDGPVDEQLRGIQLKKRQAVMTKERYGDHLKEVLDQLPTSQQDGIPPVTIRSMTGLSETQVHYQLRKLLGRGVVVKVFQGRRPLYRRVDGVQP